LIVLIAPYSYAALYVQSLRADAERLSRETREQRAQNDAAKRANEKEAAALSKQAAQQRLASEQLEKDRKQVLNS
jgi:hypothetical protein